MRKYNYRLSGFIKEYILARNLSEIKKILIEVVKYFLIDIDLVNNYN